MEDQKTGPAFNWGTWTGLFKLVVALSIIYFVFADFWVTAGGLLLANYAERGGTSDWRELRGDGFIYGLWAIIAFCSSPLLFVYAFMAGHMVMFGFSRD